MPPNQTTRDYLESMLSRLDNLENQSRAIRMSTIRMACFLSSSDPILREQRISRCFEKGLLESPIESLIEDIDSILQEIQDDRSPSEKSK